MNAANRSLGSFGSRVRSKNIGQNTYKGRRSDFHSKPKPIHGPVHKYYLDFSQFRSHFSHLPQAVPKGLTNCLSQIVSYASMIIFLVINGFIPNELKSNFVLEDYT